MNVCFCLTVIEPIEGLSFIKSDRRVSEMVTSNLTGIMLDVWVNIQSQSQIQPTLSCGKSRIARLFEHILKSSSLPPEVWVSI